MNMICVSIPHVYVYIYIYTHVCVCLCIHSYIYIYIYIYIFRCFGPFGVSIKRGTRGKKRDFEFLWSFLQGFFMDLHRIRGPSK